MGEGAFAHLRGGVGPRSYQALLGEGTALFLFADSRPRRNTIVSSAPLSAPRLVPLNLTPFLNRSAGSFPSHSAQGVGSPCEFRLGLPHAGALSRVGPQPGPGRHCSPTSTAAAFRFWLFPRGTSRRALQTMDLVLASLGARCDQEEGYVYFPFFPAFLPESYPRNWNDKSVARIFKNLAILYRALPMS